MQDVQPGLRREQQSIDDVGLDFVGEEALPPRYGSGDRADAGAAYRFHCMCISSEDRKVDEHALADMRKAQRQVMNADGKRSRTHPQHSKRAQ
jgi:hypothetical protein